VTGRSRINRDDRNTHDLIILELFLFGF